MDHFHKLLEISLTQAETLMKQSGGFAPFAVATTTEGTFQTIPFNLTEEESAAQSMLEQTETVLKQAIVDTDVAIVAVCSDISFKTETGTADGLLVRIDGKEMPAYDILIPYERKDGLFFYGDMIPQHGSLNLFKNKETML